MGLVASSPEGCGLPRIVTLVDLVVVPVFYAMAAGVANAMPNRWKARSFSFAISVLMALACSFIAAAAHRMFTDGVFSVNLQICVGQTCISQGNERPWLRAGGQPGQRENRCIRRFCGGAECRRQCR